MDVVWTLATAVTLALACALLGSFLALRRTLLLGDALSHAVLPGVVLAFLWSGSRELLPMLLGAGAAALVATLLLELLQWRFRVHPDAALGAVLATFFAAGILLLSRFAGQVDLDAECVLYGELAYVPLELVSVMGVEAPRGLWTSTVLLAGVGLFVWLAYKELALVSFDPTFAASIGRSPRRWSLALMGLTAAVTVVALELVGAILVVALLVGPAAGARLLTRRLPQMLLVSALLALGSVGAGYGLAWAFDGALAGWIAVVAGGHVGVLVLLRRLRKAPASAQEPFAAEQGDDHAQQPR